MSAALRTSRAFTIVELLVVITIIGVLAAITLVGLSFGLGAAKGAAADTQLQSIGQAIAAFETDIGFLPPLITEIDAQGRVQTPESLKRFGGEDDVLESYREARYMSEFSLTVYLLGAGVLDFEEGNDGVEGFGLRNPGATGLWRDAQGNPEPLASGRVYGPYLDPGAMGEDTLERLEVGYDDSANRIVADEGSNQFMFRLLDPWGNPVRYYKGWPKIDLGSGARAGLPTIKYAPTELRSEESMSAQIAVSPSDFDNVDLTYDSELLSAPYMLLSAGERPGRAYDSLGRPVSAYGDATVNNDRDLVEIAINSPSNDSAFTPGSLDENGQLSLMEFLRTNRRYAP
ncbi:MAG: prepilin-type N-terminal cleavage/methylation domain-containing protein [Planctomycetota bacterium]